MKAAKKEPTAAKKANRVIAVSKGVNRRWTKRKSRDDRASSKIASDLVARTSPPAPNNPPPITFAEFAKRWKPGTHLTPEECDAFERDLEKGKAIFKPYISPWD